MNPLGGRLGHRRHRDAGEVHHRCRLCVKVKERVVPGAGRGRTQAEQEAERSEGAEQNRAEHGSENAGKRANVARRRALVMSEHLLTELTVFILAVFVGIEVISKVPSTLHTPLMSATNAIHGIVLVGAILVAGTQVAPLGPVVGFLLVVLASLNVFGGYTVTERMLAMFKPRAAVAKPEDKAA
jgi:NAD(P) transhydrogenase subunit alpha